MKVCIDSDEWYPVYTIDKTAREDERDVEIDQETYDRWERALVEFEATQDEMREARRAANDSA